MLFRKFARRRTQRPLGAIHLPRAALLAPIRSKREIANSLTFALPTSVSSGVKWLAHGVKFRRDVNYARVPRYSLRGVRRTGLVYTYTVVAVHTIGCWK